MRPAPGLSSLIALAFCLWNSNIAFPSLLEQEFTADPELATPPKDSITWHFFIHTRSWCATSVQWRPKQCIEKAKERSQESPISISSWQGVRSWYNKSYSFRAGREKLQLVFSRRREERQERGYYFNKATSSGILSFIKDVLLLFNISPNLKKSPNLNPTALTTTKPPESRHYYRMIDVQRIL